MQSIRTMAVFLLALALPGFALAQPAPTSVPTEGPKWFHHHKKNPNAKKVHHAKPSHRTSRHKPPKH